MLRLEKSNITLKYFTHISSEYLNDNELKNLYFRASWSFAFIALLSNDVLGKPVHMHRLASAYIYKIGVSSI